VNERIESHDLVADLERNGVIAANAPLLPPPPEDRPWFVSALQGTAGWLAGLFGLGFIAVFFKLSDTGSFAIFGVFLLAGAFGLYRATGNSAFAGQLALAASIAGQVAVTFSFAEPAKYTVAVPAACVALMQCVLVFVMPNRLARALAAFFACVAWALTLRFAWWGDKESWDMLRDRVSLGPALIGWVAVWIPVAAMCAIAIVNEAKWMAQPAAARIIRPALTGLLLALTFGTFASEPLEALEWFRSTGARPENWLVLWPLLNALLALCAAFGAFRLRNKALLGVAIAAALLHVGQFYFLLGTTLVVKSIIMLGVGAALVIAGMSLRRKS
jgi:uncharacterized protein DUF4401